MESFFEPDPTEVSNKSGAVYVISEDGEFSLVFFLAFKSESS
jgi:hypothetical protein